MEGKKLLKKRLSITSKKHHNEKGSNVTKLRIFVAAPYTV